MKSIYCDFLFGLAVEKWWKEHGVQGLVILANRDNDTVLEEREQAIACGDEVTPVQDHALNRSTCGAIKIAQIAGAIFNHKDDKKDTMTFFVIGGRNMLAHHSPFQTLQTIAFSYTAMQLRHCFCKGTIGAFLWPELAARSFRTLPRFCWSSG